MPSHVLLVDADLHRRQRLADELRAGGHRVEAPADPQEAAAALTDPGVELLVLDLTVPTLDRGALRALLGPDAGVPDTLEGAERRQIARMLEYTRGNRRQAALHLGISRSTLLQKIRKYGLDHVR